jgi:hypothetical protein
MCFLCEAKRAWIRISQSIDYGSLAHKARFVGEKDAVSSSGSFVHVVQNRTVSALGITASCLNEDDYEVDTP